MYAGVEDVRLLDGGFEAWIAAGYEVETTQQQPTTVTSFGAQIPTHPEYLIDREEVQDLLTDPGSVLVSIRSWEEFAGKTSGYHYITAEGRIPGAVWGLGGEDTFSAYPYRNIDHSMRSYHETKSNWKVLGITPEKRVAFYCGTGWRASEAFFNAFLMGWKHFAVFDGGWLEWSKEMR
jgi:thiosulfate/3-mercaptopyruvate sulfurtransferase